MKNFKFYQKEVVNDKLFEYPCVDSNGKYLDGRKTLLFNSVGYIDASKLEELGAEVYIDPNNDEMSFPRIGVIAPVETKETNEKAYYHILDYYIHTLQTIIHKMGASKGYNHIVVLLPSGANQCHSDLEGMAYYAVYGLIQGLGAMYAPIGIFINGIVLSETNNVKLTTDWIAFLASDNACNMVGQVICL